MFDRSILPDALFEFVVIADTHYMSDVGGRAVEFQSRLRQTRRAETALQLASSLQPAFIIHLGDLVQEYPDTAEFPRAFAEALAQLERCGVAPYHVAGNHDVGDKPDPTMPTRPVTVSSLANYHEALGQSWYSFDQHGCHFVVLNSQILNTALPAAVQQQEWLPKDLAEHQGERIFLFLHMPLYLHDEAEPASGHYDNISEPARSWVLDLTRRYELEIVVAAHVHCAFFDHIGATRYVICNSTSFTRPGFPHMFTSSPPPERGRDDAAKLGFYLFRVLPNCTQVHFIRTGGAEEVPGSNVDSRRSLITRIPPTLERSPLGVSLLHPLSWEVDIPLAWPSAIRQRVRNDYPLLGCLELGVSAVRTPATDLNDSFRARRLAIMRDEGVSVVATLIWSDDVDVDQLLRDHAGNVDSWELQLPGILRLRERHCQFLRQHTDRPICLSTIIPDEVHPDKQHARTRHGFWPEELAELDNHLRAADIRLDRVLCRLNVNDGAWRSLCRFGSPPLAQIGVVDWLVDLSTVDDIANASVAAEAIFGIIQHTDARLFVEPLIDFDRTMDIAHGLLDTLCNPRPAFHVLRVLNSVLGTIVREPLAPDPDHTCDGFQVLRSARMVLALVLPRNISEQSRSDFADRLTHCFSGLARVNVYSLSQAHVANVSSDEAVRLAVTAVEETSELLLLVS